MKVNRFKTNYYINYSYSFALYPYEKNNKAIY